MSVPPFPHSDFLRFLLAGPPPSLKLSEAPPLYEEVVWKKTPDLTSKFPKKSRSPEKRDSLIASFDRMHTDATVEAMIFNSASIMVLISDDISDLSPWLEDKNISPMLRLDIGRMAATKYLHPHKRSSPTIVDDASSSSPNKAIVVLKAMAMSVFREAMALYDASSRSRTHSEGEKDTTNIGNAAPLHKSNEELLSEAPKQLSVTERKVQASNPMISTCTKDDGPLDHVLHERPPTSVFLSTNSNVGQACDANSIDSTLGTLRFERGSFHGHKASVDENGYLTDIITFESDDNKMIPLVMADDIGVSSSLDFEQENENTKLKIQSMVLQSSPIASKWFCITDGVVQRLVSSRLDALDWCNELTVEMFGRSCIFSCFDLGVSLNDVLYIPSLPAEELKSIFPEDTHQFPPFRLTQLIDAQPASLSHFADVETASRFKKASLRPWVSLKVLSIKQNDPVMPKWVWFLVDTGSPATFMSQATLDVLSTRKVSAGSLVKEWYLFFPDLDRKHVIHRPGHELCISSSPIDPTLLEGKTETVKKQLIKAHEVKLMKEKPILCYGNLLGRDLLRHWKLVIDRCVSIAVTKQDASDNNNPDSEHKDNDKNQ